MRAGRRVRAEIPTRGTMRRKIFIMVGLVALALGVTGPPAIAYPETQRAAHVVNGRIAYGFFTPELDDTVVRTLDPHSGRSRQESRRPLECPTYAPDGIHIATCGNDHDGATAIINTLTHSVVEYPMPDPDLFTACNVWSPDMTRLACAGGSDTDNSRNGLYTIRVSDGKGLTRVTRAPGLDDEPGQFSPDGRQVVFARFDSAGDPMGLFTTTLNGRTHRVTPLGTDVSSFGAWSPDGRWLAYSRHTNDEVRQTIWLVHPDGSGLHPAPGCYAVWWSVRRPRLLRMRQPELVTGWPLHRLLPVRANRSRHRNHARRRLPRAPDPHGSTPQ